QSTNVSWTVQNAGSVAAPGSWSDSVYVSRKSIFDSSAVLVGSYSEGSHTGLAAGGGYFDNEQITVPQFATGTAYLLFVTDYANGSAGQPQSDTTSAPPDANDVFALKVTLAAPDLQLTGAIAPAKIVEGESVGVSWTVKNAGGVPADGAWTDQVFVSSKSTWDATAISLGTFSESSHSALDAGASYTDTESIAVPQFAVGSAYLLFVANYNFSQPESDGGSGYFYAGNLRVDANNVQAVPITLTAPDLSVTAATAPSTITSGSQIAVSWTVKNLSANAPAADNWSDSVYLSSKPTYDSSATFIQTFDERAHTGLAPGASYTDSEQITVPSSFTSGGAYLLFVTDNSYYYNSQPGQPQSDFTGTSPDGNDVYAVAVSAAPEPDLQVTAASAPAAAVVGNGATIAVSYTVTNNSAVDAKQTWYDGLYASDKQTWDAGDSNQKIIAQLNNGNYAGPLAAGASYTVNQNVPLPNLPAADKYLLFVTNVYGDQPESDGTPGTYYNSYAPDSNDVKAVPIALSVPNVDLQITAATLPAANSTLTVGDEVPVSFTIKNAGSEAAAAGWNDEVYFSQKATLDSSAIALGTFAAPHVPLAGGASYTQNQTVSLYDYYRNLPLGAGYLLLVANSGQSQLESDAASDTNDLVAVPVTLAAPDLAVTAATAPATAPADESSTASVRYTVTNQGTVNADGSSADELYISDKQTFDSSDPNQQLVGTLTSSPDALAPNDSYTLSKTVTLPSEPLGQMYLLFVANANGGQVESDALPKPDYYSPYVPDANDVKAVAITYVAPQVDLVVTTASAPATIESGNGAPASVSYTVTNKGTDAAAQTWHDKLYVSSSPTFDGSAKFVANLNNPAGTLAAGASYTVTQSVTLPPVAAGPEYLLFVPDADGGQPQSDITGTGPDVNDVKAVAITTSSPNVDLAASSPSAATTALNSGQQVEVKFTVSNNGGETAAAAWTDAVYLSTKSTLDSSAIQLTSIAAPSSLAAGGSYQFDQAVTIPTTFLGSGFLLFVTNDNGAQGETDGTGGDDVANLAVTVSPPGLPDLSLTAATAPATAPAEQADKLPLSYTVTNVGAGPANAPWRDDLYLSDKQTFDPGDPNQQYITALNQPSILSNSPPVDAGASYTISSNVTLPPVSAGPRYLLFVADGDGNLPQADGNSAGPDANDVKAVAINFTSPNVDLQLTAATVNGGSSAPIEAGNGATVPVSYTVTNAGGAATTQTWSDELYISDSQTLDASAQLVANLTGTSSAVAPNGTYTPPAQNVALPPVAAGTHYLLFVTNIDGGQPEADSTGALPDANDVK
ncbi:MAG TPA: CARDB domain-containing protein, partial [Pirellulales bacterium]|nr:CARDB domain-containing protein [Pirellulales bacterium]